MSIKEGKIVIIGGGVIGLAIARAIAKRKICRVVLIERGRLCNEASFAAAGMLTPNVECEEYDDFYLACRESNRMFPSLAAELLNETGMDIELRRDGAIAVAKSAQEAEQASEKIARQIRLGIPVEIISAEQAAKLEPAISPTIAGAAFYPEDGQVDNRKLSKALALSARLHGVEVIENTQVTGLLENGGRVTGIRAGEMLIEADRVVVAAGAWTDYLLTTLNLPLLGIKPIRGQIMAYFKTALQPKRIVINSRFYAVPRNDGRLIIGATSEDVGFCKQVLPDSIEILRRSALEIFPWLNKLTVGEAVAGLRPFCSDSRPLIGEIPSAPGLLVATGHYRNGILLSPWTAEIVANEIFNDSHQTIANPFRPKAITSASAK